MSPLPSSEVFLADLVSVRGQFVRSVHLERDTSEPQRRSGYHLTESAFLSLNAIAAALWDRPSERALSLIGPYGSGKSAFCVQMADLLSGGAGPDGLKQAAPDLSKRLRRARLLPVLVVGARQPMAAALVAGLERALTRSSNTSAGRDAVLGARGEMAAADAAAASPRAVADLLLEAARGAKRDGRGGLLLVIDEMGKLLEYAAQHPEESDIFLLQEIAEAAARSGDAPLLVVTVLHQGAEAYAQRLGRAQQAEWAKVSERFHQTPFFPSDREQMDLIGRALCQDDRLWQNGLGERLDAVSDEWLAGGETAGMATGGYALLRQRFPQWARAAYPLHPLTLLALPALFRRAGQSHRSLFTFLSGEEPHALGRFLRETRFDASHPPLYGLERLFDYAAETLMGGSNTGAASAGSARAWAEAREIVDRASHQLSPDALRALKTVALLGLLREPLLSPTEKNVTLALSFGRNNKLAPAEKRVGADAAAALLEELTHRRLAAFRRRTGTYRLWEGGDVDVEAELARARGGLPAGTTLRVARDLCPPPTWVARRHSHEKGTLRTVRGVPCAADRLAETLKEADGGDLRALLCLASDPEEAARAEAILPGVTQPGIIAAVAVETDILREAAADVAAAERVAQETEALTGDRAARRELAARRAEAEAAFRAEWNRLLGPEGAASWWWRGNPTRRDGDARAFARLLSDMAEKTFYGAPTLRNELINRRTLSSAAAGGRRTLIEAMLTQAEQPRLGITGYPPEASMYASVLYATGLHRKKADAEDWEFGAPPAADDPAKLQPAWYELTRRVFSDPPGPRPLPELFDALGKPPYGLTAGVLPVLLCAFLRAHDSETTLYRDGTFLAEPGVPDWEVLLRRPELFAIAGSRVTGARAAAVARLARGLNVAPAVVPVVRALLRMGRSLPEFAGKTRRLPPEALAVREALDRARSPEALLFEDLPRALGVASLLPESEETAAVEGVGPFFAALNGALGALRDALPNAQAQARDALLSACGLPAGERGWAQFRARARYLEGRTTDEALVPLLRRASAVVMETSNDGGDVTVAVQESVLALVAGRPSRTWSDADAEGFPARARAWGERFRAAVVESGPQAVVLSPQEADRAEHLTTALRDRLPADAPPRILRAALRALLAALPEEDAGEEEEDP